jgi:heterodisulfide reductase subunit A
MAYRRPHGFLTEAHIKLYPVESSTKGIYLAGCGQGPKDISDTVSQASATASKVQALLSTDKLLQDPLIAFVDRICSAAGSVWRSVLMRRRDGCTAEISAVHHALCQDAGLVLRLVEQCLQLRNASAMNLSNGSVCLIRQCQYSDYN